MYVCGLPLTLSLKSIGSPLECTKPANGVRERGRERGEGERERSESREIRREWTGGGKGGGRKGS